jgi:protein-disulfide isomerase
MSGTGACVFDRRSKLTLALAVALGVAVMLALRALPPPRLKLGATPVVAAVLEDPGSPAFGAPGADVTVVVFTDYQCPICRATEPDLDRVLAEDPRVRVVYKDWPILGEASRTAARAALAAHRQGRYRQLHAAMMRSPRRLDPAAIAELAGAAGLDVPRLQADLAADAPAIERQLAGHARQAWSLGLQGTPAYLVGPYLVRGRLGYAGLRRAIARARADP